MSFCFIDYGEEFKMKVKIIFLISAMFLISCNNVSESSNFSQDSSSEFISSSINESNSVESSSIDLNPKLRIALEEVSVNNITFRTNYEIYYYEIGKSEEKNNLQHFDVYSKITDDAYNLNAYIYDSEYIASSIDLLKSEDGYASYTYLDRHNVVQREYSLDAQGNKYLWDNSVYFNFFAYLSSNDFEAIDENTYRYSADLTDIPLYFVHSIVPVSAFDLESMILHLEDNHITSITFQEKESDDVYIGYMYGRILNTTFDNIGTTSINQVAPYAIDENNDDLGEALNDIRSRKNYTITSIASDTEGVKEDFTMKQTQISDKDVLITTFYDGLNSYSGLHTNDSLYTFDSIGNKLYGKLTNQPITNYLPTFDFSKDVFRYISTDENGIKTYEAYPDMNEVIDFIDVNEYYSGMFFSSAGGIRFLIKDKKLIEINFPMYVNSESESLLISNHLIFDKFNETSIPNNTWDNFITSVNITSWEDETLLFNFYNHNVIEVVNPKQVFDKALVNENNKEIVMFLPNDIPFVVSGNVSNETDEVYLTLSSYEAIPANKLRDSKLLLSNAGFKYRAANDAYINGNIEICFIEDSEGYVSIEMVLPLGSY